MKTFSRLAALAIPLSLCVFALFASASASAQDIKEGMPDEKIETPQTEAPKAEAPKTEAPKTEAPAANPADIPPMPERRDAAPDIPMAAFGTAHPECLVWNDNCQSCARDENDHIFCSTPGIACLSDEIACKKSR